METKKGILLTNKMSIPNDKVRCVLKISLGMGMMSLRTRSGVRLTVLPFKADTLGPKIVVALLMSSVVTGQFFKSPPRTMFWKSRSLGYPIVA